ncbi:MAG: glycoside hydrolase family 3 N-terminal domain-containing protein [candidate division KSB1 bacterium]|nr:glycoside hydrolase family 3 N-terminal domain-containing protein [candidate division KSB1 bacterium]
MQKWFIIIYCCCISILFAKSDTNAGIEKRIQTLLDGMSLEEKIGQMSQISMHATDIPDPIRDAVAAGRLGSVLNAGNLETKQELQKIAVQESPSGIPLIFGRDVIHGYQTVLPIPLGQSCSWNPDLIELGARMAAAEASANGVHWTFAPMIDITRDPRWGRIAETCGEDPYLTSVLARAMVRGFQSDNLSAADALAACAKHYVGYGAAIGGRDYNTTLIPERQYAQYLSAVLSCCC